MTKEPPETALSPAVRLFRLIDADIGIRPLQVQ